MDPQRVQQLATRAGVDVAYVERLSELGILPDRPVDADMAGDERRIRVVLGLDEGGIPVEVLAEAIRTGHLALDFVDQPAYERFAGYTDRTFQALSDETGIPIELLMFIREAGGSARPMPDDRVRADE